MTLPPDDEQALRDEITENLRMRYYSITAESGEWRPLGQYVVDLITAAVEAERNRHLEICEKEKTAVRSCCGIERNRTCEDIAAAIEARGTTDGS